MPDEIQFSGDFKVRIPGLSKALGFKGPKAFETLDILVPQVDWAVGTAFLATGTYTVDGDPALYDLQCKLRQGGNLWDADLLLEASDGSTAGFFWWAFFNVLARPHVPCRLEVKLLLDEGSGPMVVRSESMDLIPIGPAAQVSVTSVSSDGKTVTGTAALTLGTPVVRCYYADSTTGASVEEAAVSQVNSDWTATFTTIPTGSYLFVALMEYDHDGNPVTPVRLVAVTWMTDQLVA